VDAPSGANNFIYLFFFKKSVFVALVYMEVDDIWKSC
jgi:hypothetical protein